MITKSTTYRKEWDHRTPKPNADTFIFESQQDWPDEPFWDLLSDFFVRMTGRRPLEVAFMRGSYYGFDNVDDWIAHINEDPQPWEVQGHPTSFMLVSKCGHRH